MKCYLANNSNGRFVTAKEASTSVSTPVLVPRTF
ncbi:putative zinc ribbon protein [Raoultella ornithinolytica]